VPFTDGSAYAILTGTRKIPIRKTERPNCHWGSSEEVISSSTYTLFIWRYFSTTMYKFWVYVCFKLCMCDVFSSYIATKLIAHTITFLYIFSPSCWKRKTEPYDYFREYGQKWLELFLNLDFSWGNSSMMFWARVTIIYESMDRNDVNYFWIWIFHGKIHQWCFELD